jgi:hypothetical protein
MMPRESDERRERYADPTRRAEQKAAGNLTSLNLPEGMKFFKVKKAGLYRLDFLPSRVGKHNPYADEGMLHYERTYYVHSQVGADNGMYACPRKTFGKKCPICEHAEELSHDPDNKELADKLRPKERQLFFIIDRDNKTDGVQLFEFAWWNFGKHLDRRITTIAEDDPEVKKFFHRRGGRTMKVDFQEEAGKGYKYFAAASIDFAARTDIDKKLLTGLPSLDDLPVLIPYDELKAIFMQTGADDPSDDSNSARARRAAAAKENENPSDDPSDDAPPPKKGSKAADPSDDPSDDTPPPSKKKTGGGTTGGTRKQTSPSDDDPSDDAPPPKKGKGKAADPSDDDVPFGDDPSDDPSDD